MARLAFKPDASFFRKIVTGAIGARAVRDNLATYGHEMVELERGSTDTKLWKDVKRKRVRIPDLVCIYCGLRVESRAKTKEELSMSHSFTDSERAWDFGMVENDLVAFPICEPVKEEHWSSGRLENDSSYWHERNWLSWKTAEYVNYFQVKDFRLADPSHSSTKGVTEGSETSIAWDAIFVTMNGVVEEVNDGKIKVRFENGRSYTWQNKKNIPVVVNAGQKVYQKQVIASSVTPIDRINLKCSRELSIEKVNKLLSSRERTQRFTGIKLARLRGELSFADMVRELAQDYEEDVYVRLEGVAYLVSVCGESAQTLFSLFLNNPDPQIQLEAVITLAETKTDDAVELLGEILNNTDTPFFLRSAAAWSLSRIGSECAIKKLVRAFSDINQDLREEALEGLIFIGQAALPALLSGITESNKDIAAGCAEAIRLQVPLPFKTVVELVEQLKTLPEPNWVVWLLGHLSRDHVSSLIAELQETHPELHYAISVLWSFTESWIARRWELNPKPID